MNLDSAISQLSNCITQMDALYFSTVFDEWVILTVENGRPKLVYYHGPRAEIVLKGLHSDSAPIYSDMIDRNYEIGDFEFTQNAEGSKYDAYVRLGEKFFLLCNNTKRSMSELRSDPRWRTAQKPFLDFTEKFRADSLV